MIGKELKSSLGKANKLFFFAASENNLEGKASHKIDVSLFFVGRSFFQAIDSDLRGSCAMAQIHQMIEPSNLVNH